VLIEESTVELLELFAEVSEESKKEKESKILLNRMAYWWTRKPLIVGRAMILSSTLDKIGDVKLFLGLESSKRAYQYTPDIELYKEKLGSNHSQIKVLDPFGGQGNLIFPAAELGLDVTCSDYNPVAYLLEKAVLEYPVKYGPNLIQDVTNYAKKVIIDTEKEIGKFFKTNQLSYIWVWCIKCPYCKQRIPLTNKMWIAKSGKKNIGLKFRITKDKNFTVEIIKNISENEGNSFTHKGKSAKCISCTNPINYETLTNDISQRKDKEMIVIQIQTGKKRDYILPNKDDKERFLQAENYLKNNLIEFEKLNIIPNENIRPSHQDTFSHYGINKWTDFFNSRQLLVLITLLKNGKKVISGIRDPDLKKVISVYLGFLVCRTANMSGTGVAWNRRGEKPEHVHTFRRPAFNFNHAEINPFEKVANSLQNNLKAISNVIQFSLRIAKPVSVNHNSVTETKGKFDLILADPPYGYDVQYGELSDFFYIWLYRLVNENFSNLPSIIPLDEDFCVSFKRFSERKESEIFFEKGLKKSFVSMSNSLKKDGLLVVFFAHSSPKEWDLLLQSIREAKFRVVSSYAIHTELESSVVSRDKTAFTSSIVVTCRKITKESTQYFEDLIPQIEDKIKKMISQIPDKSLLTSPITNLLIMVYGKVLEACTQHTTLKSYQKDFTPDFETLIKDARSFIIKEIVTKLTGRTLNVLGAPTAFYLLAKIFHHGILSSDDALKIARTYGMSINILEKNNVAKKEAGVIRLLYLHENELDLKPEEIDRNVLHQQLCYLVQVTKKQGATKIKPILTSKNFRIDDLKQIISLLIKSFRLRINKNEKLNDDEKKELQILESISDVMGIKTTKQTKGGLDKYFEDK